MISTRPAASGSLISSCTCTGRLLRQLVTRTLSPSPSPSPSSSLFTALCLSATAVVDDLESTRAKQGRVNEGATIRETNEQNIVYWVDTIHD